MLTTLSIIFVFGSVVLVHEFGHFIVARWFKVKVLEFSFGFGPKIVGYQGKDTLYALRIVPLGGFVRLHGMDPEVDANGREIGTFSKDPQSFMNKPVWQRMAVIAAGGIMNFVLAIVLFIGVFAYLGIPSVDNTNTIGSLVNGKPAAAAGIVPGDKIVAVNQELTPDWTSLTQIIHAKPDQALSLTIERGNQTQTLTIKTEKDTQTGNGMIGIAPEVTYVHASILESARYGIERSVDFTKLIIMTLVEMVTGKIPVDVGGPVMIGQAIGEAAQRSLADLMMLAGIISIQLGIINLFPIPALDGSRLVFLFVEGLRGKPLNPDKENMIHFMGFVLLMTLMVAITYKDILGLFRAG